MRRRFARERTGTGVPSISAKVSPAACSIASAGTSRMRSTFEIGIATRSSAMPTSSTRCTAAVIGTRSVVVVPCPRSVRSRTSPPSPSTVAFTASMPTPRPETSETPLAVESPGWKMKRTTSSGGRSEARSSWISPAATARRQTEARSMPRPSSATSIQIESRWRRASIRRRPGLGLARGDPVGRLLEPVVDRVAHEVEQRLGQAVEDRAVELELGAEDLDLDALAELLGDGAGGAGQVVGDAFEGRRAELEDAALELGHAPDRRGRSRRRPRAPGHNVATPARSWLDERMTSPTAVRKRSRVSVRTRTVGLRSAAGGGTRGSRLRHGRIPCRLGARGGRRGL
jgi:hypothetical protein